MHVKSRSAGISATSAARLLAQVPIFSTLPDETLGELGSLTQRRKHRKDEVIFHEGDPGAAMYVVARGEVKIILRSLEGKEATLGFRRVGDFFGELALLDGEPRSATIIATEPCEVLVLQREDFMRFLERQPRAAINLLAIMSRRVRSTTQLVHDISFLDVRSRLIRSLLTLVESRGERQADGRVVVSPLFQNDLANMVGATRESINKWLKQYERRGFLRLGRGKLIIIVPERLRSEVF